MKKKIRKKYFFIAVAIETIISVAMVMASNLPVLADDESEEEIYEEEYVVTATRIPQSLGEVPGMTETISGEEVDKGIDTISEVLAENGLPITTNGGESSFARLQMDGVNDSQLQFLVNGVPIHPDQGGCVDLSYFPSAGLEKIEVVHGPLSALYGANALGGVVNIITDLTRGRKNTLSFGGGSFGSQRWGAEIEQEKWGLAVGGNTTDGHRPHSSAEGSYFSGQYDIFRNGEEYLILRGNFMSKDARQPGNIIDGYGVGQQEDQRIMTNLSGKAQWLDGVWEYKIYSQKQELEYEDYDFYTIDTHIVDNYGIDVAALYEAGNHELLAGSMYKVDSVDSTSSGKHSLDNIGLYFQDMWYISGDLLLLSGLRWDHNSQYKAAFSPRMSLTKYFTEGLNLSFGYGEAFRAPTISDLYYFMPAWNFYGNPDLKPEKSKRFDITVNWRSERSSFVLNIYRSLIKNGIESITIDDGHSKKYSSMINIGRIRMHGLNMNMEKSFTPNFAWRLGYGWLEKMNLNRETGEYSQSMDYGEHRWDLALKYKEKNLTSSVNWQIVSGRTTLPDYTLVNFSLKYQLSQALSLSLVANNLLEEEYEIVSGYPMPGRSFSAGLSYNF